jgi:hypothetical protein
MMDALRNFRLKQINKKIQRITLLFSRALLGTLMTIAGVPSIDAVIQLLCLSLWRKLYGGCTLGYTVGFRDMHHTFVVIDRDAP